MDKAPGATLAFTVTVGNATSDGTAVAGRGPHGDGRLALEASGGVRFENPGSGLSVSFDGRALVLHEVGDLEDWGGASAGGVAARSSRSPANHFRKVSVCFSAIMEHVRFMDYGSANGNVLRRSVERRVSEPIGLGTVSGTVIPPPSGPASVSLSVPN